MNDHFSFVREIRNILKVVAVAMSTEPPEGEWNQIRAAMFRALRPFDEARRAVWDALSDLGQLGEVSPL